MRYEQMEILKNNTEQKVCLFGAGVIGCTWAYDLLDAMGFCISFYCDNRKEQGIEIRNGVKTISTETLYLLGKDVLVFVTVTAKYQESIMEQLKANGISNAVGMDWGFLSEFIESLIEINDESVKERFKNILDDTEYLKRIFRYRVGYPLDLNCPQTFNGKLQWLKIYDKNPAYTQMVDKYEAKKYLAEQIGEEYIVPLLGVYDSFDEIDFAKLPQQFVLKCTHDSGGVAICKDVNYFNKAAAKKALENNLKINFYWVGREYPYFNVKPRIIAEKYIENNEGKELIDYKFMCFNGRVKLIFTCSERFGTGLKVTFFDLNWNKMPFERHYPSSQMNIPKPQNFAKMITMAEKLSADIPFVRIDFYEINGHIYVGEITFYPGGGMEEFSPQEWDRELGTWLKLPIENRIRENRSAN